MTAAIILTLALAASAAAGNLVPNASFETLDGDVPDGWSYNRQVVSISRQGAHSGELCLRACTDLPVNVRYERPYTVISLTEDVPVEGDRVYWLSMWSRAPRYGAGYPCLFYARWLTADGKPAGIERSSTGADRLAHDWRWTRARTGC